MKHKSNRGKRTHMSRSTVPVKLIGNHAVRVGSANGHMGMPGKRAPMKGC
jgi:hypothetical protein